MTFEDWADTIREIADLLDVPLWDVWSRVGEELAEAEHGSRLDALDAGRALEAVEGDRVLQDQITLGLVAGAVAVQDDAGSREAAVVAVGLASAYLARQLRRWMRNAVLDGRDPVEALAELERSVVATDAAHTVGALGATEAARHHELEGTVAARADTCPMCVPRIGRRVGPDDAKPPWHSGCDCATLWDAMAEEEDGE